MRFLTIISLFIFNSALGQDTIREVYPPKHLYLPLSFGFSDHATFGLKYNGKYGEYMANNPNADIYKSSRITANYTVIRTDKHAVDLGFNFDSYSYKIGSYIQEIVVSTFYPGYGNEQVKLELDKDLDLKIVGLRFSPYLEYNYAFNQDKIKKHSAGIQVNYGFYGETFNSDPIGIADFKFSYYALNGLNTPNGLIYPLLSFPAQPYPASGTRVSYGGIGLQLHYDFLYVHTNFDDLRVRAYYATSFPNSVDGLRNYHKIGIGLFLHIGRRFPNLDKF